MSLNKKTKQFFLFFIFVIFIGFIIGTILWGFLKFVSLGINFIWYYIPNKINLSLYTIIICIIGGIIIGIVQKKFGEYPEELKTVIKKIKKDGKYPYKNLFAILLSALLPLLFGASIGPEAGLTGVIAGLCYWANDEFSFARKNIKKLTNIGVSTALSTIFMSPIFGLVMPYENEMYSNNKNKFPKTSKIVINLIAIFSALFTTMLLNNLFGAGLSLPHFNNIEINQNEYLWIIPLSFIGALSGYISYISKKVIKIFLKPIKNKIMLKAIILCQ